MINRFGSIRNAKAHAQLRRHELNERIEKLDRHIKDHAGDPDFARSIVGWRRELMESKLERSSLGLS